MSGACWSTAICAESERRALGLASDGEWLLTCRLSDGHLGDHATDASVRPRQDRRMWLTWNDRAIHRIVERDPCPMRSRTGTPCLLYGGHGGMHYYGAPAAPPHVSAPTTSIETPDIRMPAGINGRDHDRPGSPVSAMATAVPAVEAEPIDVEVATGPAPRVEISPHVAAHASAPEPTVERVREPSGGTVVDRDQEAVSAALVELASAIEKLADAVRRRAI